MQLEALMQAQAQPQAQSQSQSQAQAQAQSQAQAQAHDGHEHAAHAQTGSPHLPTYQSGSARGMGPPAPPPQKPFGAGTPTARVAAGRRSPPSFRDRLANKEPQRT
eukprot:6195084-Pleurochrysis_carterae.AAC.3